MRMWTRSCLPLVGLVVVLGCGQQQSTEPDATGELPAGVKYVLAAEPETARGVIEVRADARDDETVVVVGRIGGSGNPWVDGRTAFSIVDSSLKACSDIEGDDCKTPWDYCCETDRLAEATLLVKIVDESGKLVAADTRALLGLKELQTVVVEGQARRDDEGNLTVLAGGVYVRE